MCIRDSHGGISRHAAANENLQDAAELFNGLECDYCFNYCNKCLHGCQLFCFHCTTPYIRETITSITHSCVHNILDVTFCLAYRFLNNQPFCLSTSFNAAIIKPYFSPTLFYPLTNLAPYGTFRTLFLLFYTKFQSNSLKWFLWITDNLASHLLL